MREMRKGEKGEEGWQGKMAGKGDATMRQHSTGHSTGTSASAKGSFARTVTQLEQRSLCSA